MFPNAILAIALLFAAPLYADSDQPLNLAPAPIKLGPQTGKSPKPLYHSRIQTPRGGGAQNLLKSTQPISNGPDSATQEGLLRGTPNLDPAPNNAGPPIPYFDGRNPAVPPDPPR